MFSFGGWDGRAGWLRGIKWKCQSSLTICWNILLLPIGISASVLKWHLYLCDIKTVLNYQVIAKVKMYREWELTAIVGLKKCGYYKKIYLLAESNFPNNFNAVL